MKEKLHTLVLLTPGFAKDVTDTTCIPVMQLFVKKMAIQYPGLQIIVLAFHYPFSAGEYNLHGARVIGFNGRNRGRAVRLLVWIKVWFTLNRLVRKYQVVGLLSFWFSECALIGSFFGRRYRVKQFSWFLGQDARAGNKMFKLIRPDADSLIVLSDALAGEVYKNYSLKLRHVIPFGVDASVFPAPPQERTVDIMGAGSLIPLKRYDLFVKVIQSLVKKFPDLKVVLCGKGTEKHRLLELIEKGQLQKNITLMDEVPHAQVLALMQQSKIFLHTSEYEGFAAVCAEALCAGAQVVSFCQPIHQPIRHWHIVHSEEALLRQLELLLRDQALSHESVLPYTIEEACTRIMALFGYQGENNGA
jgi:glycosyltransferase involved in cell wall biosynthesis